MERFSFLTDAVKYISAYLVFILIFGASGISNNLDWWLYERIHRTESVQWDQRVWVIDLPQEGADGSVNRAEFRARLGDLLQKLAILHPTAVVLDIWFESGQSGTESIEKGLKELKTAKVPIYGTVEPRRESSNVLDADYIKHHIPHFYETYITRGHNLFNPHSRTVSARRTHL